MALGFSSEERSRKGLDKSAPLYCHLVTRNSIATRIGRII
jgi:hypothetical protein